MKPYYEHGGITIYHGDCREVIPVVSFDLCVTSPPYNKGKQSGAHANMKDGYASYSDDLSESEYVSWQREVLSILWRGLLHNGAIFYNHKPVVKDRALVTPLRLLPPETVLRQIIVLDRGGGVNYGETHLRSEHEWVLLLAKYDFALASRSASAAGDVWRLGICQDRIDHPCSFPLSLPETAIGITAARTILDPFCGSGTTLQAAKNLGRKAIGIEIEERYCEIAAERLSQEVLAL